MDGKKETSIAYYISHIWLRGEVFNNWAEFNSDLSKGPKVMQEKLVNAWNNIRDKLVANEQVIVKDRDRIVTPKDFKISFGKTESGCSIFYISFPDSEVYRAEAKCVAIAFTPKMPKYFTMEYAYNEVMIKFITEQKQEQVPETMLDKNKFIVGEWYINFETKAFEHRNYGEVVGEGFIGFIYKIHQLLASEQQNAKE